jgi:hypothetical protein
VQLTHYSRLLVVMTLTVLANSGCNTQSDSTEFWPMHTIDDTFEGADGVDRHDIDGDGDGDLVVGWEESGQVVLHENPGPHQARDKWRSTNISGGLQVRKIEDARFADFDNDGNVDAVVTATENHSEKVGIHWLVNRQDIFNKDSWKGVWIDQSIALLFLKVAIGQVDGIGANDIVVGSKDDTKPAQLVWYQAPENPDYGNSDQWKGWPIADIHWINSIEILDIDQDGDNDVLMSDWSVLAWFENPGRADALKSSQSKWARHVISTRAVSYFTNCAMDKNDSSKMHLIVSNVTAKVHASTGSTILYSIRKDLDKQGNWSGNWIHNKLTTLDPVPGDIKKNDYDIKGIACGNIDSNENIDLVMSASGYGHGVFALMNMEKRAGHQALHLKVISDTNYNTRKGIKHDNLILDDLDGDGDLDIITTEENGNTGLYFNDRGLGLIWYENPLLSAPQ